MTSLPDAVPIEIRVTRFVCPFCRRGRSKRALTVAHIGRCWSNPATRACRTCSNYDPGYSEPDVGYVELPCCRAGVPVDSGEMVTGCPSWEAAGDG